MDKQEKLNSLLKGILNASPDLIFAKDMSYTYIACNDAFSDLIQKDINDIIGNTDQDIFNNTEQVDRLRATDEKIIKEQKVIRVEEWATYPNGRRVLLDTLKTPFYNDEGELIGLLGVCRDITANREAAEALKTAKIKAETATAAKSDFLARMSHEIRTPMNAVIGLSHILLRTGLEIEQKDYVEKILTSGESLLNLINDILDFSKIEAGKLAIEETPFDLPELTNRAVNLSAMAAHSKGLELIASIDPAIPNILLGDPLRLQQIIVNLMSNAVKFTNKGSIYLNITIKKITSAYLTLQFAVTDTGIGMSDEQQKHLFTSFSQADESITRKYGGTGLGLSISKQLSELMGGEIWLESKENEGSTFYFTSNLQVVDEEVTQTVQSFEHLKVLIVDDIPLARKVLASTLEECGIFSEQSNNGFDAINKVQYAHEQGTPYDLVLMDWRMPKMDGIETSKRIGKLSLIHAPHILMVSAYDKDAAKFKAINNDVSIHRFLEKPVNRQALHCALNDICTTNTNTLQIEQTPSTKTIITKNFSHAHILLVEDDAMNQLVATTFLADSHAKIDVATDGLQAIEKIKNTQYDLVLMDIQMPNMDGLTATKFIRENLNIIDLPIIAMTAHAMEQDIEKSRMVGMNEHITKPIAPQNLFSILDKYID